MEMFITASLMAIATGSAAGLRPYFTVFFLGLAKVITPDSAPSVIADAISLIPDSLTNVWVLVITGVIALCEFLVDKFQFLDSAWDVLQGILRPIFGALVGLQIGAEAGTEAAITGAVLGGGAAAVVGLGKSTLRAVINMFPEPVSNFLTSLGEDTAVVVILMCAIFLPAVAAFLGVLTAALAIFLFRRLRSRHKVRKFRAQEYRVARSHRDNSESSGPSIGEILG